MTDETCLHFRPLVLSGLKDLLTPQKVCEDESLYDFVSRRFGHHVAQYAIDPMVRGICAGNAKEISAKAFVAGPLFELEQEYGGIFKGLLKRKMLGKSPKPYLSDSVSVTNFAYLTKKTVSVLKLFGHWSKKQD